MKKFHSSKYLLNIYQILCLQQTVSSRLFPNQKSRGGSGPSESPYFPFCFTFHGHSNVRLISAKHIGLTTSIVCAFAEHGGRKSLKKNPFTREVRRSWIPTNATLMRSASGEGGCVAHSADGWADTLPPLLLCFGWFEATMRNERNAPSLKTLR